MSAAISCWVASEQVNIASRATTTSASPLAASTTRSTSTWSEMLPPQRQT
jgi:hypothetical protein